MPADDAKDTVFFVTKDDVKISHAAENDKEPSGAIDPKTGEINWDCPCLGGMAKGPCGEEFKTAFSCFVRSEADPKGSECVQFFQTMQQCFQVRLT
jgi:intermembrane space import and assembly protein 40